MRINCNKRTRLLFIIILLLFCHKLPASSDNDIAKYFSSIGAKRILSCTDYDEYLLNSQKYCVYYNDKLNTVCTIAVYCIDDADACKKCIKYSEYNDILNIVNNVKKLGKYVGRNPFGLIIKAGWRQRHEDYQNAIVLINETSDYNFDDENYGINKITMQYWLRIKGRVVSKRINTYNFPQGSSSSIAEYILGLVDEEVTVSKNEYQKYNIGKLLDILAFQREQKRYVSKNSLPKME